MGHRMMILWTPAQRRNPILVMAQTLRKQDYASAIEMFDEANDRAWVRAGLPADEPGTRWWDWEDQALRFLKRWFR